MMEKQEHGYPEGTPNSPQAAQYDRSGASSEERDEDGLTAAERAKVARTEEARRAVERVHPKIAKELRKQEKRQANVSGVVQMNIIKGLAEKSMDTTQRAVALLSAVLEKELALNRVDATTGSFFVIYTPAHLSLQNQVIDELSKMLKMPCLVLPHGMKIDVLDEAAMGQLGWVKKAPSLGLVDPAGNKL